MDKLNIFLDNLNKTIIKEKDAVHDPFFNEDNYALRYKKKGIVLKHISKQNNQIGGSNNYKFVSDNVNFDSFVKEIEKEDSKVCAKLKLYELENQNLGIAFKVRDYVCEKYSFNYDKSEKFTIGDKITELKYLNTLESKYYLNEIPKNVNNANNFYMNIKVKYIDFMNNTDIIKEYISKTLELLNDGGNVIMYIPIIFNSEKFYEMFKWLCEMFGETTIYFPTYFAKINPFGYIILKNKLKKKNSVSLNLNKKILKYLEKYMKYIKDEYMLIDKLLAVKYHDDSIYKILYNKILSKSLLHYMRF